MAIQIVRFKDGLDVISHVMQKENDIELTNPMMFEIRNKNLLLQHWLPIAIMKSKNVTISRTEILCFMEPNDDFAEYYDETVSRMESVVKISNKDEMEEIMEAMDELESIKGVPIH